MELAVDRKATGVCTLLPILIVNLHAYFWLTLSIIIHLYMVIDGVHLPE